MDDTWQVTFSDGTTITVRESRCGGIMAHARQCRKRGVRKVGVEFWCEYHALFTIEGD